MKVLTIGLLMLCLALATQAKNRGLGCKRVRGFASRQTGISKKQIKCGRWRASGRANGRKSTICDANGKEYQINCQDDQLEYAGEVGYAYGDAFRSCDEACATSGMQCDMAAINDILNPATIIDVFNSLAPEPCTSVIEQTKNQNYPARVYTGFYEFECYTTKFRAGSRARCDTKAQNTHRLCSCLVV
eukprot:m.18243 g.18243  ORF g.18243 m.18243 type:complete len:188 (-) comp7749_c0_seq1:713-1276(-)